MGELVISVTIKPCPFCGGEDIERQIVDMRDREGVPICMSCPSCGASGPWSYADHEDHIETAIDDWNTRIDAD